MKSRDYKVVKEADGKKIYFAKAFGEWVEVTKEVFKFMVTNDRRTRYLDAREAAHREYSIDEYSQLYDDSPCGKPMPVSLTSPSAEDSLLRAQDELRSDRIDLTISEQVKRMTGLDYVIVSTLLIQRRTLNDCAAILNMPPQTIWSRYDKLRHRLFEMCLEALCDE